MESNVHLASLVLFACDDLWWPLARVITQTLTLETIKLDICRAGKVSRLQFESVGCRYIRNSRLGEELKGGIMLGLLHTVSSRIHTWHVKLRTSIKLCPTWLSVLDPGYLRQNYHGTWRQSPCPTSAVAGKQTICQQLMPSQE